MSAALLPLRLTRGFAAIARIVRREKIDLIHTNMEVVLDGAIVSRLLRIPHVLHYRGNTNDDPKIVFDALTRFWTLTADKVFCISNATADIFRKRGLGAKVETLYNPVDIHAFSNAERSDNVRRELGAAPGSLLVGTVGRIHPRKDLETFFGAAALVAKLRTEARFAIIGSAEAPEEVAYEARLNLLASELGISDRLVWAGARRDVPLVLKALDVFVLCSRNEGFGRVVAEALTAGTPVVASREGALPELLAMGGGVTVPPSDCSAFAEAIACARVGTESHRLAERFSAGEIARFVLARYSRLLQNRGRVAGAHG